MTRQGKGLYSSSDDKHSMKAVGFDLGDTLIFYEDIPQSWETSYVAALNAAAVACNRKIISGQISNAAKILEEYNTRINPRTKEVTSDEVIGKILESWNLPKDRYLDIATDSFFRFFQRRVAAYDDTVTVLRGLREKGLKIGVLTDVPYGMKRTFIQRDLEAAGISAFIDVLLPSVDVGHRKPEPVGYVRLASEMCVDPQEMLFVGNEEKDVEGANRAGVQSVLLDRGGERLDLGQRYRVENLYGVEALLR